MTREQALAELSGPSGPVRFAVVREGLYRGGQPNARHLELLRAIDVETIVNLRWWLVREEKAAAARLGLRVVRVPFTGTFRVGRRRLMKAIDAIKSGGNVYVHCHVGRDRTSLVIAFARVVLDGWSPEEAWQREAIAFGYRPDLWHREMQSSFWSAVAR